MACAMDIGKNGPMGFFKVSAYLNIHCYHSSESAKCKDTKKKKKKKNPHKIPAQHNCMLLFFRKQEKLNSYVNFL